MFAGLRMDTIGLPGSVLADLYIRLRDEIDGGERNLDPNHKLRAPIAMAILAAAENFGTDAFGIETQVRQSLGLAAHSEPAAAGFIRPSPGKTCPRRGSAGSRWRDRRVRGAAVQCF
jgi:hypothetical protein